MSSVPAGVERVPIALVDESKLYPPQKGPEFLEFGDETQGRLLQETFYRAGFAYAGGIIGGGLYGALEGINQSRKFSNYKLKLNAMFNCSGKRGAKSGNAMGVLSAMYSITELLLSNVPQLEENHDILKVSSGLVTGLVYKSTAGLKGMGIGGLVGASILGLSVAADKISNKSLFPTLTSAASSSLLSSSASAAPSSSSTPATTPTPASK